MRNLLDRLLTRVTLKHCKGAMINLSVLTRNVFALQSLLPYRLNIPAAWATALGAALNAIWFNADPFLVEPLSRSSYRSMYCLYITTTCQP